VGVARVDCTHKGSTVLTRLNSGNDEDARTFLWGPVLCNLSGPGVVKPFIEASYAPGMAASKAVPLERLILTLVDIRGEPVVHTQGLLAANFLEIVRYHFARNALVAAGKASQRGDQFYRVGRKTERSFAQMVKHLFRCGRKRPMGFAEILKEFCRSISLAGWSTDYVKFRNRVVHGDDIVGATLLEQHGKVLEVLHFCDRIILALLDWDRAGGKYIPCVKPDLMTPESYGINVKPFLR
jgi:hypothetical protein